MYIALATASTWAFVEVSRTVFPLRRQQGEGWLGLYVRVYQIPGTCLAAASVGVAKVLELGGLDSIHVAEYALITCVAAAMAVATRVRLDNRGY